MVVLDGNFALGCRPGTDYPKIHKFQCLLERTDGIMNEVLEPITFVLAYLTIHTHTHTHICIYIYISVTKVHEVFTL